MRIKLHSPILESSNNSLRDFLRAKGFKSTKEREILLNELETRGEHFNAESLYSGYAAGDCCEVFNLLSQDWVHTPLGDIANKQGRVAGENVAGGKATFSGVVGSAAFKVFELEVAFTGLGTQAARQSGFDVDSQIIEAESKVGYMPGSKRILIKLIFDKKDGRLLGAQMTGGGRSGKEDQRPGSSHSSEDECGRNCKARFCLRPSFLSSF